MLAALKIQDLIKSLNWYTFKKKPAAKNRLPLHAYKIHNQQHYIRKLISIPADTADPITPATLGAMACMSR